MLLRVFSFSTLIIFCASCDYFTANQKNYKTERLLDINFSSVDVFPSFPQCDSLIDASKKNECFTTTIHQLISEKLLEHPLITKNTIDEIVTVHILVNVDKTTTFKGFDSSDIIKKEFPQLDSLLQKSVENLPKMFPATKRGIPVASQYQIPIQILSKE